MNTENKDIDEFVAALIEAADYWIKASEDISNEALQAHEDIKGYFVMATALDKHVE